MKNLDDKQLIDLAITKIGETMKVGQEINPFKQPFAVKPELVYDYLKLRIPTRLNAMGLAPSELVNCYVNNLVCKEGEVLFSVNVFTDVETRYNPNPILPPEESGSVVEHTKKLVTDILGVDSNNLNINIKRSHNFRHCGMGSTGALMAATATSLNKMFDDPIQKQYLCKYLAQNYGEEIDGDYSSLMPVQCIGGSLVNSMYSGAIKILSGESQLIYSAKMPEDYYFYILMPENYDHDSKAALSNESSVFQQFLDMDKKFRKKNADALIHRVMPALTENNELIDAFGYSVEDYPEHVGKRIEQNFKILGEYILDYKVNSGSLQAAADMHSSIKFKELFLHLKENLYEQYESCVILSVSSAGPGMFMVCSKPMEEKVQSLINGYGFKLIKCRAQNEPVIEVVKQKATVLNEAINPN